MKYLLKRMAAFGMVLLLLTFLPFPHDFLCLSVQAANADKEPAKAELNLNNQALVRNSSFTLTVYNLTEQQKVYFKTNLPSVAYIENADDKDATVTGLKVGTATVSAVIKEGHKVIDTLECEVIVGPPAKSIVFSKPEVTIIIGKRLTLKTILKPGNAVASPKYISDDKSIVTISSSGRITAKSAGDAYVYAKLSDTKYDRCLVHVIEKETSAEEIKN